MLMCCHVLYWIEIGIYILVLVMFLRFHMLLYGFCREIQNGRLQD